ncbi:hypothetical protein [Desulfosediminicola flagellatus]|uniref:hypothetical protein n=1 Tax=Desulfosediminicola flagellatus TaxID=2569541 RepID=UPI0010AD514F|nr:hypothetical protein [Desulfosediminicola flagellatus]
MVKVNFKLSDAGSVSLSIDRPESLELILTQCAAKADIELGGYIAVRAGKVLKRNDIVGEHDEIDIFPAISGG